MSTLQKIGLGGPGLRGCVVTMSPVRSPKRAQESPKSEGVNIVSTQLAQRGSDMDIKIRNEG